MDDTLDKYRIDEILEVTPMAWQDMTRWNVRTTRKSNNLQEDVSLLAKPNTKYNQGDVFFATRETNQYGVKLKRQKDPNAPQSQQGGGGGYRGSGGGSGGGSKSSYTAPVGIPYLEAIDIYRKIASDLGIAPSHEYATTILIAILRGDVMKPGQVPQPAAQSSQPTAGSTAPPPTPPPTQGQPAADW